MAKVKAKAPMTLMRVRRMAQLTLPAEMRRALNVREGDYLEARIVKDGVLLKPVAVVERERAWEDIRRAVSQVKDTSPVPGEDMTAKEEKIAQLIKERRHKTRKHG